MKLKPDTNSLEQEITSSYELLSYTNEPIGQTCLEFIPKSFEDYLGQEDLKKKLSVSVQAALLRQEPLDHVLLFGPPGLGKTTLATIMAHQLGVGIKICSGPMLERTGDLVALLTSLNKHDIFFIDEIHRMPTSVEEVLYSAMEQFKVDVIIGQGAGAQSISMPLAAFTLIGATTKSGMISAPLRTRFGITERLEYYNDQDLQKIVLQNASFLNISLDDQGSLAIAQASRGTPRVAKKILRRVRDYAQVKDISVLSYNLVREALEFFGIDNDGLTQLDRRILYLIINNFKGGPVGLDTLSALVGEDAETLEEVYEPFLLRKGYLEKTARGRQIAHKSLALLQRKLFNPATIMP